MRVLPIEDNRATAHAIELMLKLENFDCCITYLGEEGFNLGKEYLMLELLSIRKGTTLMCCATQARTKRQSPPKLCCVRAHKAPARDSRLPSSSPFRRKTALSHYHRASRAALNSFRLRLMQRSGLATSVRFPR